MRMGLRSFTNKLRDWRDQARRDVAISLFDKSLRQEGDCQEAIVFVRWDAKLGDTVVLSWAWRAIKAHRPDLKIWIVTGAGFYDLFEHTYGFDKVILAPSRPGLRFLFRIAAQIKRPRYVVHLSQSLKARDLIFLRLLDPVHVASLDDALRCVDIKLGGLTKGRHFSEKLIPFLNVLSVPTTDRQYWLPLDETASKKVMSYWPDETVIGFCPNGASRHRCFSDDMIVKTVRELLRSAGKRGLMIRVFLIVTSDQGSRANELIAEHGLAKEVFSHPTHFLAELLEQVRACAGVVSVDTGIVHVAAGLNKPLLAFYHPPDLSSVISLDNYASWHPNSTFAQALIADRTAVQRIDAVTDDRLLPAIAELLDGVAIQTASERFVATT